jgi:hypothetical protein
MATGMLTMALLMVAAGQAPTDLVPLNQQNFEIPIRIDQARRAEIKELLLFTSRNQGQTWEQVAVAGPDKNAFTYFAPADGVYWFSVQVVDRQGNREPPDIYKATPGQKVVIDTVKPVVKIHSADRQGDEVAVHYQVQDERPDLTTLKLEYKAADPTVLNWTPVTVTPAAAGQARFKAPGVGPVMVRMQVQDLAGNPAVASAEAKAGAGPAATVTAVASHTPTMSPPAAPAGMTPPPPIAPGAELASAMTPPAPVTPPAAPAAKPQPEMNWEPKSPVQQPVQQTIQPASLTNGGKTAVEQRPWTAAPAMPLAGGEGNSRLVAASRGGVMPAGPAAPGGTHSSGNLPALTLSNSTELSLDYDVTKVGPSGLGKVELFVTTDDGRTWQKPVEDADLKSPITVTLPGEGVYGFWLVLTSKAGLAKRSPQEGDLPQMRIEVDTTLPEARLYAPEADVAKPNTIFISWEALDKNLPANPVNLYWAQEAAGPWQAIAEGQPASGKYGWNLPTGLPYQVYLKMSARDSAGNESLAATPRPITIDLTAPEGAIKGLTVKPARPMALDPK